MKLGAGAQPTCCKTWDEDKPADFIEGGERKGLEGRWGGGGGGGGGEAEEEEKHPDASGGGGRGEGGMKTGGAGGGGGGGEHETAREARRQVCKW